MNITPIKHIHLPTKFRDDWDDGFLHAIRKNIMVVFAEATDDAIIHAIIQKAKKNGITDLYVLNEDFIIAAIREKIERENIKSDSKKGAEEAI